MEDPEVQSLCKPDLGMPRENRTLQWSRLLDFHMQYIFNITNDNLEFMQAMRLLESAINMVKHKEGFTVVDFHLRRVQALVKGHTELDLHLSFLMECIHAIR